MSKTVNEVSAEVEGMKNSIKSIVEYFINNNPTIMPNVEIDTVINSIQSPNNEPIQVSKEVVVYVTVSFLK